MVWKGFGDNSLFNKTFLFWIIEEGVEQAEACESPVEVICEDAQLEKNLKHYFQKKPPTGLL